MGPATGKKLRRSNLFIENINRKRQGSIGAS